MSNFLRDLKFSLRSLGRRPAFVAAAVATLAVGIGANSAIFSVVSAVLLQPLPYQKPADVVVIWETSGGAQPDDHGGVSGPNFSDWQRESHTFASLSAFDDKSMILAGGSGPEQVTATNASGDFFDVLGAPALRGRTFNAADEKNREEQVVVLSYGLWTRRFGADPKIVGSKITINDAPRVVLGVMPPDFRDPLNPKVELWTPLGFEPKVVPRGVHWLTAIARLKPGVSLEQAQAEMDTVASGIAKEYPDSNHGQGVKLVRLREEIVGNVRPALLTLLAAVSIVLLIACANVAILLLARASGRGREIAVRAALGATRGALVRQLVTEGAILGIAGSVFGILLTYGGVRLLLAIEGGGLPRVERIGVDGYVLAFTLGIGLLTGLLAGLVPAFQLSRRELAQRLKDAGGRTAGSGGNRTRNALVVLETSLALVLLIGAGLVLKSLWRLQHIDPGFNPDKILTAQIDLAESKYPKPPQQGAFFERLLVQTAALPGAQNVGAVSHIPLRGENVTSVLIENQPPPDPAATPTANFRVASANYFATMGIPLLRGRVFNDGDRDHSPLVVVIDEAMAKRFGAGQDPLNRRVSFKGPEGPWLTVVGVVRGVRLASLKEEASATVYAPFLQRPRKTMIVVARTGGDPLQLAAALRRTVGAIDADQPMHDVKTMQDYVSDSLAKPRFNMLVLSLFSLVALLLAALGIYSVLAYAVAQSRHEIGVRMALGAQRAHLVGMVVKRALSLVAFGLGIGLVAAFASSKVISSLLFDVQPTDTLTYFVICLVILLSALAASLFPARRATAVDPVSAFRSEE